jgi:hypothetical protein
MSQWVKKTGPHYKGVVEDLANTLTAAQASTTNDSTLEKDCSRLAVDTTSTLNDPLLPGFGAYRSDLKALKAAAIECETAMLTDNGTLATTAGNGLDNGLTSVTKIGNYLDAHGGSLKHAPLVHTSTSPPTSPQSTAKGSPVGAEEGYTNGLDVTLEQVIDPATAADSSFGGPDAGTRFVGIQWKLSYTGSSPINDDANNDTTVQGSDDQDYSAAFYGIAGCTNFNSGEWSLTTGGSVVGCVTVQIPNGVSVAHVDFQLGGGFNNATLVWNVG